MLDLSLNPNIDIDAAAETYRRDGLVQIPNVLEESAVRRLFEACQQGLTWRLAFPEPDPNGYGGERVIQLAQHEISAMDSAQFQARIQRVFDRAADNHGYLYSAYPLVEAHFKNWDPGHPIHEVLPFLNTPELHSLARRVIDCPEVTKIDGHASLYGPGHFLTRHIDDGRNKERRAAYTLGLTPHWEPDWGGLLMFLDDNQDVSNAYLPRFNTLTIFDGLRVHSVSAVSQFAKGRRLQITGWFRSDPPEKPQ